MEKINWILRDWRKDEATQMDPELIDLLWEIHSELGSAEPIHIISGFRSRDTNEHAAQDASADRRARAATSSARPPTCTSPTSR